MVSVRSSDLDTTMLVSFTIDRPGMEQFVADSGFEGGLEDRSDAARRAGGRASDDVTPLRRPAG